MARYILVQNMDISSLPWDSRALHLSMLEVNQEHVRALLRTHNWQSHIRNPYIAQLLTQTLTTSIYSNDAVPKINPTDFILLCHQTGTKFRYYVMSFWPLEINEEDRARTARVYANQLNPPWWERLISWLTGD